MKIYFAGSIRGGRDDQDLYFSVIAELQKYGTVLTEHIGDKALTGMGETRKATFGNGCRKRVFHNQHV